MLKAMIAANTATAILIDSCLSGVLGRGDREFPDITQFLTKTLTFELGSNYSRTKKQEAIKSMISAIYNALIA